MSNRQESKPRGLLERVATRPIFSNLLMLALLVVGGILLMGTKREVFPSFQLDRVRVVVPWEGASANEIEEGVLFAVERAVLSLEGVKRVSSEARRGVGIVLIELNRGVNAEERLREVESAVARISTLPGEAERPVVSLDKQADRVLSILIHGEASQVELFRIGETVRQQLMGEMGLNRVEHAIELRREVRVELDPVLLEGLRLNLRTVESMIRESSVERHSGYLQSGYAESGVGYDNRLYTAEDFSAVVLRSGEVGAQVRVSDVGRVYEGLNSERWRAMFQDRPAIRLDAFREGEESPGQISEVVRAYFTEFQLPQGFGYEVVEEETVAFESRVGLLLENAWFGLVLVGVSLFFFLEGRVALWVLAGIPVTFVGAFIPIYLLGGSINMYSLAAFIVALGVVVDDAIIVGEGIAERRSQGMSGADAVTYALRELAAPVVIAIATNIIAFLPMFFLPGFIGKILYHIPVVVVSVFLISLVECLLILPAHSAGGRSSGKGRFGGWKLNEVWGRRIRVWSRRMVRRRYVSLAGILCFVLISLGLLTSGWVGSALTPRIEANVLRAVARLPIDAPFETASLIETKLVKTLEETIAEEAQLESDVVGIWAQVSDQELDDESNAGGRITIEVVGYLKERRESGVSSEALAGVWERKFGEVAGVETIGFSGTEDVGSDPLILEFKGRDEGRLKDAVSELKRAIERYDGVLSVDTGAALGQKGWEAKLNDRGRQLGLSDEALSRAMQWGLRGREVMRYQDGLEEVGVRIRYPNAYREDRYDLWRLPIFLENGSRVDLREVADVIPKERREQVLRSGGRRVDRMTVTLKPGADEDGLAEALESELIPEVVRMYPEIDYAFVGEQQEDAEMFTALSIGLGLACLGIYALIAVFLNSYTAPLVIVAIVPLGIAGAIWGHLVMGEPFSLVSFVGVLALAGIVVNDALVLLHTIRGYEKGGMRVSDAAVRGIVRRLRPIFLTSVTTFLGLMPLLGESSMQARFLVPLAISLGFGILFSTVTTLVVVPCLWLVRADAMRMWRAWQERFSRRLRT